MLLTGILMRQPASDILELALRNNKIDVDFIKNKLINVLCVAVDILYLQFSQRFLGKH